jgi:hypothetical protein
MCVSMAIGNTSLAARLMGRDLSLSADFMCLMMSFVTVSVAARRAVESDFWRAMTA